MPSFRWTQLPTTAAVDPNRGSGVAVAVDDLRPDPASRYQRRSFHPIVVGSRPGKSATDFDDPRTASRSSGARRVDVTVGGLHRDHDRARVVQSAPGVADRRAGPPLHIRGRPGAERVQRPSYQMGGGLTWIDADDAPGHRVVHRGPAVLAVDPGTHRAAPHHDTLETEVQHHADVCLLGRGVRLTRRQLDRLSQGGHGVAELTRRRLTRPVQRSQHLLLRRRDPVVAVVGDAVVGEQLHEPAVLGPEQLRRRGCVGHPRHRGGRDPQRAPHRVEPDHATGLVERGLHRRDRRVAHPHQRREEHRHRIRGMQRNYRVRDHRDVVGSCRGDQTMAARQPSASLADRDASRSHGSMMTERDEGTDGPRRSVTVGLDRPAGRPGHSAVRGGAERTADSGGKRNGRISVTLRRGTPAVPVRGGGGRK